MTGFANSQERYNFSIIGHVRPWARKETVLRKRYGIEPWKCIPIHEFLGASQRKLEKTGTVTDSADTSVNGSQTKRAPRCEILIHWQVAAKERRLQSISSENKMFGIFFWRAASFQEIPSENLYTYATPEEKYLGINNWARVLSVV